MSYTPKNNFNLKMIKIGDTVPVYTPENNSNLQLKRTGAGDVGFRKKLWKIVINTCDDPEYYFRLVPKQDSFYKNDSQEVEVVGGVGDFSWTISGSGFSLADATTSGRTNTVSTDGTVGPNDSAVLTVVDSCGTSVSGNLKVCYNVDAPWVEPTPQDPVQTPELVAWFDLDLSNSGKYQSAIVSQPSKKVLYISKDYGYNWRYESSLQYSYWYCIRVSSSGQYQIAGNSSGSGQAKTWLSSDYGVTWTILSSLGALHCVDAAFSTDGQYQTVVLSDKTLWISSDYGSSWTHTGSGFEDINPKVILSSSGQYQLVIYDDGYVYLSSDYGQTWADSGLGHAVRWHIAMSSSGQYQSAAVRYNSRPIWTSSNYGVTWVERENAPAGSSWSSIGMSADGQYQSCPTTGSIRRMYYSSDSGVNWAYTFSTIANLDDLVVSESGKYQTVLRGFVSSDDQSKLFVSSDYGVNWGMKLDPSVYPAAMLKVAMSTSGRFQLAITGKTPGKAYRSNDYGETWTII